MGKTPDKFTYRSLQDRDSIAAYMQALLDGIQKGELSLVSGGNEMVLEPNGLLRFQVEARRGAYRSRVTLKISWRDRQPDSAAAPLEIKPRPAGE
jgi:amphi-Trp domain-containing protein